MERLADSTVEYAETCSRSRPAGARPRRLRIFHLITTLEPAGAQTLLFDMARRLDPERFEVMIGFLVGDRAARWILPPSIEIFDLSRRGAFDPLALPKLARLLRARRVDLVHTHLVHAGIIGKLAARAARVRATVTTRHYASEAKSASILYRWEDRLTRGADRVVAVSDSVRVYLLDRGLIAAGKIRVVCNGIDFRRFDPAVHEVGARRARVAGVSVAAWPGGSESMVALESSDPALEADHPIIGSVGRLHPQKGCETLLRAFALLRWTHPTARLEFVGDGPLRADLERLAGELGLAEAVRFRGNVPPSEIPDVLAGWDLFAFPSRWEAFGLALLEAMAMELPVVASRVEGICELVEDGETGRLVPPDDPVLLAAALRQLLSDPQRARSMGERARESVRHRFTADDAARALSEIYEEILG